MELPFRGRRAPIRPRTDQELELLKTGDEFATRDLLLDWDDAVLAATKRCTRCPAAQDDLAQVGRLTLVAAAKHFDPSRAIPFNHYAARAIRNDTLKAWQRTRPLLTGTDDELRALAAPQSMPALEVADVREWLCQQPRSLQRVYVAIYRRGMTQREAAKCLGVSQAWVSVMHRTLLERGRRVFANRDAA